MGRCIEAKLNFLDYAVVKFSLDSSKADSDSNSASEMQFGMDVEIRTHSENELNYRIDLIIDINESKEAFDKNGFRLSLQIAGIFEFSEEITAEEMEKMISLNAVSMLFSTARGVIAQLTTQSIMGKFVLPSVNLVEFFKHKAEEESRKAE